MEKEKKIRDYDNVKAGLSFASKECQGRRMFFDIGRPTSTSSSGSDNPTPLVYRRWRYFFYMLLLRSVNNHQEVIIQNARNYPISFHEQGFTLWSNPERKDIDEETIKDQIGTLYPDVKNIDLGWACERGPNAQRYAQCVHTDLNSHVNDFKKSGYVPCKRGWDGQSKVVVLGIWHPFKMKNAVENNALAVCDYSSIEKCDLIDFDLTAGCSPKDVNMTGSLVYNENQKWYYYAQMRTNEVLFFKHFEWGFDPEKDDHACCIPHSGFKDSTCEKYVEKRHSKEYSALITF